MPAAPTQPASDTPPARAWPMPVAAALTGAAACLGVGLAGAPSWAAGALGAAAAGTTAWAGVRAARTADRAARARADAQRVQAREAADAAANAERLAARWRAVFEGVAAPTLVVRRPTGPDEAIRIVAANTAAGRLLDRPAATLIGADLDDVFTDAALAQLVRSDALGPQEAPGDEDAHTQIRFIRPDHAVSLDVAARPGPPDEGAPTLVLTLSDSTEAARAAQLKMDFAANAGHELRTPIAAIRLAAETMAAARGDAPMTERLRRMIEDNVRRLEEMIEDLLDLSRLESPELQVRARAYDLMDLSARIDELLAPRAVERDVSIQWRVEPEARVLVCDPLLLELVVRNLVDNAVKFARPGTSVTVEASAERTLNTPRPDAVIRVRDKGVGIPLKDQQRIFERFYQVDASRDGHNRRRGTGLGLAIVKHALRRLGGSIKVDSVWQQGTTMTVRLPATIGTTEELAAENQAHPDANEA